MMHNDRLDFTLRKARVIFYLAASVTSATAHRFSDRTTADIENFTGLLGALSRAGNRPTVVFTSSAMVYDATVEPPYDESSPTCANTTYAAVKLGMEEELFGYAESLQPVVLRLAAVYGPGHRTDLPHGVVAHWLTALARGQPVHLLGDLGIRRDYVYIDDVVDAMVRITSVTPTRLPRILNIGYGLPVSLGELLGKICEVTGCPLSLQRQPGRESDRPSLWLDNRRTTAALGWRPQTSLATGLRYTWNSINAQTGP